MTFRVWAPRAERVALVMGDHRHEMFHAGLGVHELTAAAGHGDDYWYALDGREPLPDPCSRWQPEGVRGPSRVVDPGVFSWNDLG